jgi:Flp pilus assembly protein TadD
MTAPAIESAREKSLRESKAAYFLGAAYGLDRLGRHAEARVYRKKAIALDADVEQLERELVKETRA